MPEVSEAVLPWSRRCRSQRTFYRLLDVRKGYSFSSSEVPMTTGSPSAQSALARASVSSDSHGTRFGRGFEEQIATLYRLAPGYYLVTLVAAGLVCAVLQSRVDPARLWGWLAAVIVLTAIRFTLL
jgi:hypothetical protein